MAEFEIQTVTVVGKKLELASGMVKLNAHQAEVRLHNLRGGTGSIYEIVKPIEFKVGEEVGIVIRELPKAQLPNVDYEGKEAKKPEAVKPEKVKPEKAKTESKLVEKKKKAEAKKEDTGKVIDPTA